MKLTGSTGEEGGLISPLSSTPRKMTETNISPAFSPGFRIKSYLTC